MGYIKSKSNYVIKSKHQNTNDGTIYERDTVTIGGLNQFSPNQVPIYKSGNFILTINNEDNTSRNVSNNKWEENENGEIWTLNDVNNTTEESDVLNANIVLKQDYYSLKDFACFGSCSELIRASINDILTRFPGEMYGSTITSKGKEEGLVVYYTDTTNGVSIDESEIKQLGGNNAFVLDNPFGINIHAEEISSNLITDKLKYFCNDGYKNYEIYDKNNTLISEVTKCVFTKTIKRDEDGNIIDVYCVNEEIGQITINGSYVIYLYKGDDNILYYLYMGDTMKGIHIRPKIEHYNNFISSLDSFQQVILNPNTSPKYKATFEIVSENNFGYLTTVESFIMPLGNGGYNIGSNSIPFEVYLKELSDIAAFYDERFCDNLYRSMTHESIKNFDWTNSREKLHEEASEYIVGGDKISNIIRLYGRKFDDIKSYIDNISNSNTITYNDINNVPDYFLTDTLENDGWDVTNIHSLDLSEYITVGDKKLFRDKISADNTFSDKFNGTSYGTINELTNSVNKNTLKRLFKQNLDLIVKPYSKDNINNFKNGYFNTCCSPKKIAYNIGDSNVYVDTCATPPILRSLVQFYTSEREYTSDEINNAFMKYLKLNSRQLFRHKGTVDGIEMMLGMFGLKSKKWCDLLANEKKNKSRKTPYEDYDYEIKEYISFTNPIEDKFDNNKKMFKNDWYNSTKLIQYNTTDFKNGIYMPYQGLPVAYREIDETTRKLYPYFDSTEYYDGNPYYQMNGGWLRKEQLQFDKDNNIISKDDKLYTETLRTVKSVNSLNELTTIPTQILTDGDIYYVNNIDSHLAIVDGQPYEIKTEEFDGNVYQYFSVYASNNSVIVGDVYFYEFINVSYPYNVDKEIKVILNDLESGSEIKIYIIDGNITAEANNVTINNFMIFENGNYFGLEKEKNTFTKYFRINNIDYKSEISPYGWEQLANSDKDYYRLNAIVDYYKGNNPHSGNFKYDNGYEYLTYFKQIFKYAYNKELFDKRCYGDSYYQDMKIVSEQGFKGLIDDNDECNLVYPIVEDTKVHYFGNLHTNSKITSNNIFAYQSVKGTNTINKNDNIANIVNYTYNNDDNNLALNKYNLKNICKIHNVNEKTLNNTDFYGNTNSDGINHQIVNNKRIDIIFKVNLDLENLSKDKLEHIKYIDSVITPYMTQFIPPTAICTVKYI